ncbi:hypothetical protein BGZ95_011645 [Linnemannia exigua]|uniref:Uncharacterized protein n=1 Tax=Linnemannia exigua TaxID=604196 RepID=A0AAD4DM24_9FUNG|nr:hypothetical protein BGZ95_011645 [Linnemannia exigua]
MLSLLTKNRVTLALRGFIFVHSIITIFYSYFVIEGYFKASKSSALLRTIVAYSSRAILARVALYTWTLDLTSRVALVGYNIASAESGTITLASVLATRQIWIDLGVYLLAGVGLRMILDEVREADLRALQRRVEAIRGLDKDGEKDRSVAAGQGQGREVDGKGQIEETEVEENEEPQTLRNLLGKRWLGFGFFFLFGLSENGGRLIIATGNYSLAAIAFNMGVEVFGLFVITRASRRLAQTLYYALLCGVLIDAALAAVGHSRFMNEPDRQLFTDILSNFIQLPTRLPWIYPTVDCMFTEMVPIVMMRGVLQDFQRIYDEDTDIANVKQQQQE